MKNYFQISLDIEDRSCLVIGGNEEAEDKVQRLLDAGAKVTVVSPRLTEGLHLLVASGRVVWNEARFTSQGLVGQSLVMLCVKTDPPLTEQVFKLCRSAGILVCAYDQPKWCDFTMPALVKCGRLRLAVSTGGAAPALARKVRQGLEMIFDDRLARFLDWLAEQRTRLEKEEPVLEARREKLKGLVKDFEITGRVIYPPDWEKK